MKSLQDPTNSEPISSASEQLNDDIAHNLYVYCTRYVKRYESDVFASWLHESRRLAEIFAARATAKFSQIASSQRLLRTKQIVEDALTRNNRSLIQMIIELNRVVRTKILDAQFRDVLRSMREKWPPDVVDEVAQCQQLCWLPFEIVMPKIMTNREQPIPSAKWLDPTRPVDSAFKEIAKVSGGVAMNALPIVSELSRRISNICAVLDTNNAIIESAFKRFGATQTDVEANHMRRTRLETLGLATDICFSMNDHLRRAVSLTFDPIQF